MKGIKVGEDYFDFVPDEHRLAVEFIHKIWVTAGRPRRLETEGAWKVMDSLFQIWGAMFPDELLDFKQTLQDEQSAERSVYEANKNDGGYIPIAYPLRLLQFIQVYFKDEKLQDHDLILKFVKRYPMLKRTKFNL
jgi:hypothetical protein